MPIYKVIIEEPVVHKQVFLLDVPTSKVLQFLRTKELKDMAKKLKKPFKTTVKVSSMKFKLVDAEQADVIVNKTELGYIMSVAPNVRQLDMFKDKEK